MATTKGTLFVCSIISLQTAIGVEVSLQSTPGFDSNPLRLNEDLLPEGAMFSENRLTLDHKIGDALSIKFRAQATSFEEKLRDANRESLSSRFIYRIDPSKSSTVKFSGSMGLSDKTYVSRSTGQIAQFSGQDIGDRYDYNWQGLELDYRFRLNKIHRFDVEVILQSRDYHDYTNLGLSNRDYTQFELASSWRYKITKEWTVKNSFEYQFRDYLDREALDLGGNSIANSQLAYQYQGVSSELIWKVTKEHRVFAKFSYIDKSDNASGYYDTESLRFNAEWVWSPNKTDKIRVRWRYSDLKSSSTPLEDELDDTDGLDTVGSTLTLQGQKALWNVAGGRVSVLGRFQSYSYDAQQSIYTYDRNKFYLGLVLDW